MSKKMIRVLLAVVVIGGAFATLLATTMRESAEYYKHVDEVMPSASAWYGKSLQLHGFVVAGSIQRRPNTLDYRFMVRNGDSEVQADYTGVVPDTFKDDAEVAALSIPVICACTPTVCAPAANGSAIEKLQRPVDEK